MAAVACVLVFAAGPPPSRAFRVPRASLSTTASVRRTLTSVSAESFGAVIVPLPLGPRDQEIGYDGVGELLRLARDSGLTAYASVDVTLASAAGELPASRDHVMYQHPEWLMIPRELAPLMLKIDARSPAYIGEIARWSRGHTDRVGGVYVSPLDPAAAAYLANAVAAAVGSYAVDGIYLDGIAFPGPDFDYSRHTMDVFRARKRAELSAAEGLRLDEVEALDPFAYAEEFPGDWSRFRESALTDLLERVRAALGRPSLPITVHVGADADASRRDHFQDWRSWLDRGLVERVGYGGPLDTSVVLSADGSRPPARSDRLSSAGAPGGTR